MRAWAWLQLLIRLQSSKNTWPVRARGGRLELGRSFIAALKLEGRQKKSNCNKTKKRCHKKVPIIKNETLEPETRHLFLVPSGHRSSSSPWFNRWCRIIHSTSLFPKNIFSIHAYESISIWPTGHEAVACKAWHAGDKGSILTMYFFSKAFGYPDPTNWTISCFNAGNLKIPCCAYIVVKVRGIEE